MTRSVLMVTIGFLCATLVGCASGQVINLDLKGLPSPDGKKVGPLKVAVTVFEDARPGKKVRPEAGNLGLRTHIGGGTTLFDITGGQVGPAVAQAMAEALTQRGMEAWVVQAGDGASGRTPDVTISGKVLDLYAYANSHLGWTQLTVDAMLWVEAVNASDHSAVRRKLLARGQDYEIIFDPEDLAGLLNDTFNRSVTELLATTAMSDGRIRDQWKANE